MKLQYTCALCGFQVSAPLTEDGDADLEAALLADKAKDEHELAEHPEGCMFQIKVVKA